jgi:hypothetical protein
MTTGCKQGNVDKKSGPLYPEIVLPFESDIE